MKAVTDTRTLVVVGAHPRSSAIQALSDVPSGGEAFIYVLGLRPTPAQQRLTEDALTLAAERRFTLTAELIPGRSQLHERLRGAVIVRVLAGRGERRRWDLGRVAVNPPGAR
jgi:hypothetical protein